MAEPRSKKPISYDESIEMFRDEYRVRGVVRSQRTIDFSMECLHSFKNFLILNNERCLDNIYLLDEYVVDRYVKSMVEKGLSYYTISGRIKVLRLYFKLLSEIIPIKNIAKHMHKYKYNKRNKNVFHFSKSQIELMLSKLDLNDKVDIRLYAIIKFFLDTGIRLNELVSLNVSDVNLGDKTVLVRMGKGSKTRYTYFGCETKKALEKYMSKFNINRMDLNAPLIQTVEGTRWKARSIQEAIENLGKKANIENVRCSPHSLRHSFAIYFLLNGGNAFELQQLLGHESLETVKIYIQIAKEMGKKMYISFNDNFRNDD